MKIIEKFFHLFSQHQQFYLSNVLIHFWVWFKVGILSVGILSLLLFKCDFDVINRRRRIFSKVNWIAILGKFNKKLWKYASAVVNNVKLSLEN